jgi:hypothetical protein
LRSALELSLDADQRTTEEIRILTQDGSAELVIPSGSRIISNTAMQ